MEDYKIGKIVFNSKRGVIVSEGSETELDPKISALLVFFIKNQGKVVTRDELLSSVWGQTVVSDTTLNWSISQLRQALGDNPKSPDYIKTLPKKGYQFIAKVQSNSEEAKTSKKHFLSITIAIALLVIISVFLFRFYTSHEVRNTGKTLISNVYPLTSLPGHEVGGEISADGLFLVFTHRGLNNTQFKIRLKPLKENLELQVKRNESEEVLYKPSSRVSPSYTLINDEYDYSQVIWGGDSYHLYAVRGTEDSCEIVSISLALSRDQSTQVRKLTRCSNRYTTKIDFSQELKSLFIVSSLQDDSPQNLYKLPQANDTQELELESTASGMGFKFLDINQQTGDLLLLEDSNFRETSFLTYDPIDKNLRKLFHIESIYYSAYWSNKENTIWYNWGNEMVREHNIISGTKEPILHTTVGWNYDFHPISDNQAIYTVSDSDASNLVFSNVDGAASTPSSFSESGPSYSPLGDKLAYVSNQTGIPQIWIKEGGESRQVSDVDVYTEFYDLSWREDGEVLVAVEGKKIGLINLKKQFYKTLLTSETKPFFPSISFDERYLVFSIVENNKWQLLVYKRQADTDLYTQFYAIDGVSKAVFNERALIYKKYNEKELWTIDINNIDKEKHRLLRSDIPSQYNWQIAGSYLVYPHNGNIIRCNIFSLQTCHNNDQSELLVEIPEGVSDDFSYSINTGEVVFVDRRRRETNLRLADISK